MQASTGKSLGVGGALLLTSIALSACGHANKSNAEFDVLKYDNPTQPTAAGLAFVKLTGRETLPLPEGTFSGAADTYNVLSDSTIEVSGRVFSAGGGATEAIWVVPRQGDVKIFLSKANKT